MKKCAWSVRINRELHKLIDLHMQIDHMQTASTVRHLDQSWYEEKLAVQVYMRICLLIIMRLD